MGVVYQVTVIIPRIRDPGQHQLLAIVEAGDACCFAFGLGQGRQQQAGEDGDDRDDHQQFDERERLCFSHALKSAAAYRAGGFLHHPIQIPAVRHGNVERHVALE